MTDVDELDRTWRDALCAAAEDVAPPTDPRVRVAARVRRLRRTRVVVMASTGILLTAAVAVGVGSFAHHAHRTDVTTHPAPAVVEVTDAPGGQLVIVFSDQPDTRNSGQMEVPAGDVTLVIHMETPGHQLVIDGIPDFGAVNSGSGPTTITTHVHLEPGRYVLRCAIPGHAAAGEQIDLIAH